MCFSPESFTAATLAINNCLFPKFPGLLNLLLASVGYDGPPQTHGMNSLTLRKAVVCALHIGIVRFLENCAVGGSSRCPTYTLGASMT